MTGSLRQASLAAASAIVVLTAAALALVPPNGDAAHAARAATCTYEQREAAAARLRAAERRAAAARAAYFRRHKSRKQRAAFLRKQQKQLNPVRAAAACTVPALPPSSDASCSFMITRNPRARMIGLDPSGFRYGVASLYEGPDEPGDHLTSIGRVGGIALMIDFPDAPGQGQAAAHAQPYALDVEYFDEVSYGRISPTLDFHSNWVRMPQNTEYYVRLQDGNPLIAQDRFYRDAISAADPAVDFSRYRFVIVVPTNRAPINVGNSSAWFPLPGYGVPTAEGEVQFGVSLTSDMSRFGSSVPNHEFLHALGLPDTRFGDGSPNMWDAMSDRIGGGNATTHLFGWHKWKLGWLDPSQLTCLSGPGAIEETVTALETRGGKKLVVVPTSASTAYVIEARVRLGYDRSICEEGVLVYDVDSEILQGQTKNGRGVIRMHGSRRCGVAAGALRTGETFEDAPVRVEVLARDVRAFRVRVTRK